MRVKLTERGEQMVKELEIPECAKEAFESIFHEGKLVLFMSYGMSLKKWKESGTLERELKPYRELNKALEKIFIVTYGNADEPYIDGFGILYNNTWMPDWLYTLYAPWLHRHILKNVDYFKSNQMNGSITAVISKFLFEIYK